jgi:hypothetical protein
MPDFGIFRGFNEKLFGDKLYAGQLPINLGLIGSQQVSDFLLDLYPNAAAAYSLRKLRTAYTGSAIRVRRTDLQESDIGFTSLGELDTTALLAFTGTGALSNGFVTTWYDQSGNARNATQTTALNQPQIVSSGSVLVKNGKPTAQFDGTNDFLDLTSITTSNSIYSTFDISTVTVAINSKFPTVFAGSVGSLQLRYAEASATLQILRAGLALLFSGGSRNVNQQYLNSLFTKNTGSSLYTNSIFQINDLANPSFTAGITRIGNNSIGELMNGYIQEIIIYTSDQSSNRTNIEANINNFYSIY